MFKNHIYTTQIYCYWQLWKWTYIIKYYKNRIWKGIPTKARELANRNTQNIADKIFDTCSSMSKVQNNQPEITKDEVQWAIKTWHAHRYYDSAGLKNEVFKSGGDLVT